MATEWFYKIVDDEFGPCTGAALKSQAATGNIQHDSLIRKGRDGQWVAAWRVKGLFPVPNQASQTTDSTAQHADTRSDLPKPPPPPSPTPTPTPAVVPPAVLTLQLQTRTDGKTRAPARKKTRTVKLLAIMLVSGAAVTAYSWLRNAGLREGLRNCETSQIVQVDVYYDTYLANDAVVFDWRSGGSSQERRIDPVHLLLQFCEKLDLHSVDRVILARNGRRVFYVLSADLKPLVESYANGGRVWAFNHLPESARTMSGQRAFEQWTGGWLGVLKEQTDDLNELIDDWEGGRPDV